MTDEQIRIFKVIHKVCETGMMVGKSNAAREWLEARRLSYRTSGAVFNSGQIRHRKSPEYISDLEKVGFVWRSQRSQDAHKEHAYSTFAKYSVMFPLKDASGNVVNFYAVSLEGEFEKYLNDDGIYPCYPHVATRRLYIVPSVLDAAAMLEIQGLGHRDAVISSHDGELMEKHMELIHSLKHLQEIIVITN